MLRRLVVGATALLALACSALGASAQFGPGPGGRAPYADGGGRNVAGQFDYYALVLSWSPTYCASLQRGGYDPQCHRRDGKRYAFVLHGLWPQHERGWPENCPTRERPYVPQPTIDSMLDIMPSNKLVIHEYRKHGTCAGLGIDGYFDLARKLYNKVKVPERFVSPNDTISVSTDEMVRSFVSANPGLRPDMIAVACGGSGGRLREVRICFDKGGEYRACGRNENQRRMCSASRMLMPPVRSSANSPLPGPR